MIVEGQLHGGVVQGIGQALMEQVSYDESGQPICKLAGSVPDRQQDSGLDAGQHVHGRANPFAEHVDDDGEALGASLDEEPGLSGDELCVIRRDRSRVERHLPDVPQGWSAPGRENPYTERVKFQLACPSLEQDA